MNYDKLIEEAENEAYSPALIPAAKKQQLIDLIQAVRELREVDRLALALAKQLRINAEQERALREDLLQWKDCNLYPQSYREAVEQNAKLRAEVKKLEAELIVECQESGRLRAKLGVVTREHVELEHKHEIAKQQLMVRGKLETKLERMKETSK